MSDSWKEHDRPCPPCPDCGAELYERFWGNGGWAKTDKATGGGHGTTDCVLRLRRRVVSLESAVLEAARHLCGRCECAEDEIGCAQRTEDALEPFVDTGPPPTYEFQLKGRLFTPVDSDFVK
jgi:hypothetical protein